MLRGKEEDADRVVRDVEGKISKTKCELPEPEGDKLKLRVRDHTPLKEIFRSMLRDNLQRSLLGWR
jgi:hypothetical protein